MTGSKVRGKGMLAAMIIAAATILAGCNTMKGVGKDVEKVGQKTQEAAQKVSEKL
ncbi:MAG: hypothetical protein CALGDGBN_01300 [Pseudomonadales bacterium]|nr:hypothetical protein [Pseudomonadales bacterium]